MQSVRPAGGSELGRRKSQGTVARSDLQSMDERNPVLILLCVDCFQNFAAVHGIANARTEQTLSLQERVNARAAGP